jgi:hypothetical protein
MYIILIEALGTKAPSFFEQERLFKTTITHLAHGGGENDVARPGLEIARPNKLTKMLGRVTQAVIN